MRCGRRYGPELNEYNTGRWSALIASAMARTLGAGPWMCASDAAHCACALGTHVRACGHPALGAVPLLLSAPPLLLSVPPLPLSVPPLLLYPHAHARTGAPPVSPAAPPHTPMPPGGPLAGPHGPPGTPHHGRKPTQPHCARGACPSHLAATARHPFLWPRDSQLDHMQTDHGRQETYRR